MEKEKFKLLFYLKRGTQDKNGKSPIMGRISAGRSMVQFSCKCSCTPRLWDSRKNRLLGKSAEAVSVNKELDRLQVSIHKVYESLSGKSDAPITAERVRELVFGLNSESQGLLHHTDEYIDRFRERVGIDRSERRLKCLLLFHKHLANFVRYRYRVEDIPVQKADIAYLKEGTSTIEHFDIQTPDTIYRCKRGSLNWEVIATPNPTGKINVIYYRQDKAWGGLNPRIDREEDIDSKISDTNNYFADPIAAATGDVVDFLKGRADKPGKMIRMTGADSKFEYINPPTSSETQQREKEDLAQSILFDTFTPEFTPEKMAGLGTLSGEAIKRAMVLGYIKRENNKEIYDIAVDREKNLILAIMMNVTHIHLRPDLAALKIEHEFAEPFNEDVTARWAAIGRAVQDGVMSLEKGVELMGTADDVTAEIERIKQAKAEASMNNIIEPTF